MADEVILTREGLAKIKEELQFLKREKRKEIAQSIKDAKEYGDISENAEYDDAKNEQAFVEGRIAELEKMIKNVKIVKKVSRCDKVQIGCTVEVASDGKKIKYRIVGPSESSPSEGKISHESPLGAALLNKAVGEVIKLELPDQKLSYRVVSID